MVLVMGLAMVNISLEELFFRYLLNSPYTKTIIARTRDRLDFFSSKIYWLGLDLEIFFFIIDLTPKIEHEHFK